MRWVHTKRGKTDCIRCQRHAKCRPLAPAIGRHGAVSMLSAALLTSLIGIGSIPAAAATCGSLSGLTLPDTTITAAQLIPAGTYTAPGGKVFTNLPSF